MFNKQRQITHGIKSHVEYFNITRMVLLAHTFTVGVTTAFNPPPDCLYCIRGLFRKPTEIPQSSGISRTVSLLLLRMIFLTLAIISSFLDGDGRPEWGVAFNGGSTHFKSTEPVKHLCTTHCIFTVCLLQ